MISLLAQFPFLKEISTQTNGLLDLLEKSSYDGNSLLLTSRREEGEAMTMMKIVLRMFVGLSHYLTVKDNLLT